MSVESGTHVLLQQIDHREDDSAFLFSRGCVHVFLHVHLDGEPESSVPKVVKCSAASAADDIVVSELIVGDGIVACGCLRVVVFSHVECIVVHLSRAAVDFNIGA